MSWWVYKCNSRGHGYQADSGDWEDLFGSRDHRWGSTDFIPELADLTVGDMVIAYQTDRNELVGLTVVRQSCRKDSHLHLAPIARLNGTKVRDLKKRNKKIASISAFQSEHIATIYPISEEDAVRLLLAAGVGSDIKAATRKARS